MIYSNNAFFSTKFMAASFLPWVLHVDTKLFYICFQRNLFPFCLLFCQLFDNMCPLYSQTAPNTWLTLIDHFDLSPFVVIGGPGLVIHGPFDCWHVKCSVPIPKAESWFAGIFVFSCLTSDPRTITGSSVKQQRLPLAHLAAAWEMCGPRPPSEMSEKIFCQMY